MRGAWLAMFLVAGCVSSSSEDLDTEPPRPRVENAVDLEPRNGGPSLAWQAQNGTGSFLQLSYGVRHYTAMGENDVDYLIDRDALRYLLNVSVEGSEVEVRVFSPTCARNDPVTHAIAPCAEAIMTRGGAMTYEVRDPEAGPWQASFKCPLGACEVSFAWSVAEHVTVSASATQATLRAPEVTLVIMST